MMVDYSPTWEIEDSEIRSMDSERVKLNGAIASFERQLVGDPQPYASLVTGKEINSRANKILKRARSIDHSEELNNFDRVVYDDLIYNAKRAKSYYSYFVDMKSNMGVGKFLSEFFAPRTYNNFLDAVRPENLDMKMLSGEEKLKARMFSKTPDGSVIYYGSSSWSRDHHERLATSLNESKEVVEDFYRDLGVKTFDYNLQLAPAGGGFSYWEGETLLAAVDPDRFFSRDGKYKSILAKLILAHELGHGLQGKKSRNLPEGFHPGLLEYSSSIHGSCGEGVAMAVEGEFINYASESLGLSRDESRLLNMFWKTYLPKKAFQIAHDVLEKKCNEEILDRNFPEALKRDAHLNLARITKIKHFTDDFSFDDQPFLDTLQQMIYPIGDKNIRRILTRLETEGVSKEVSFNALLQGVWVNPQAQEDFIFDAYIPRVLNQ